MLQHNITFLQQRINNACIRASREFNSVTLLAVSKTKGVDTVKKAYDLGLRQFGENYVNEAEGKIPALPSDITWHFIGPIQSNKTRIIAERFSWVHSIDRLKIAQRLNDQRPEERNILQCLIQVNISEDENKSGITADQVFDFAKQLQQFPRLQLRGLMAIPAAGQSEEALTQDFSRMQQLFSQLQQMYPQVDTLSMGMSGDLEQAIAHGSTMVRIGTDLFGARQ